VPRGVAFLLETINAAVSLNPTMVACGQLKLATTSLSDSHHELRTIHLEALTHEVSILNTALNN
jgi:hypothetical protein